LWQLEHRTVQAVLKRSTQFYPHRAALSHADGNPISYSELMNQVDRPSVFLRDQGADEGDTVANVNENSPKWGINFIVTTRAVAVPIDLNFYASEIHQGYRHSMAPNIQVME